MVRGLSAIDFVHDAWGKLRRAIAKVAEPKPDHPGEAASFTERQRWGGDFRVDRMGLSNAIAAREAMLAADAAGKTAGVITPVTLASAAPAGPRLVRRQYRWAHPGDCSGAG